MSSIPGFDPSERRIIDAAMIYRYGHAIDLQEADIDLKLSAGSDELTACPGYYWNERGVQFVVCKTGEKRYRSYFFYHDNEQFRIGEQDYDFLEDCARNLLQLQADHDAVRQKLLFSGTKAGDDDGEEYLGPLII